MRALIFSLVLIVIDLWISHAFAQQGVKEESSSGSSAAAKTTTPPAPSSDQKSSEQRGGKAMGRSYEQHMDNGVKLFGEEHWEAAVAEFEAAYALGERASPLINLALCYKKLRRYAAAIRMLEKAVRLHPDSLLPRHLRAAQREIKQLRALLAYVRVDLAPKTAKLFVDGRRWRGGTHPLALSPGPHQFKVEAPGYATRKVRVRLISGRDNPMVKILLEATHGTIHVLAQKSTTWISIDNKPVGRGAFKGSLAPGVHVVELRRGGYMRRIRVVVQAGHASDVREGADGKLVSADGLPVGPVSKREKSTEYKIRSALRGTYIHAGVGLLAMVNKPRLGFESSGVQAGYNLDWRVGYRVNDWAAFEVLGQFNHLRIAGTYLSNRQAGDFTLLTGRLGAGLRAMFPAKNFVRFVSLLGAGASVQGLEFRLPPSEPDLRFQNALGVSPFGMLELGVEFEVNRVLVGLSLQNILQSSKHLTQADGRNVFAEAPLFFIGPSIRLGYAFW